MAPLVVMAIAWIVFRALGALGVIEATASWVGALRFGLAAMFLFTGVSHFAPRTRPEIVRMAPPSLPRAPLLVTLTGLLELAGAVGLLIPPLVRPAAIGLALLLVALFPANVHAARAGLTIAGPATPLIWRAPLQLFWIAALTWVAVAGP